MKKISTFLFLLLIHFATCQVKDLPIAFSKKGYIQAIDYDTKMILVNFFTTDKNLGDEEVLRSEVFSVDNCQFNYEKGNKKSNLTLHELRSSDEILVEGKWFQEEDKKVIEKITLSTKYADKEINGRIDLIRGEFAYVDGNKIKLAIGKKIKGDKNSGYKDYVFNSVNEIKEGDYAKIEGKYDDEGFYSATSFIISPNVETSFDKAALKADKKNYDLLYSDWIDPIKRKTLFGKQIEGLGAITDNEEIQDYVNRIGQKLIPEHIKGKKINFIFIVVDNPDLLAYVSPNGLAYVCTGLLFNLENEAQLATVLAHEIAHAIYEHQAGEYSRIEKKEKKASFLKSAYDKVATAANTALDIKDGVKDAKKSDSKSSKQIKEEQEAELERKKQRDENQKLISEGIKTTTTLYHDMKLSQYSIEQEYQADRVGLSLAVLAGYDPREAPVVWKNIYELYGEISDENSKKAITEQQIAAIRKEDIENPNKTYTTGGLTRQAVTGLMTIKQIDYKAKSTKTHPDEIKRYQALNKLVALYWNNAKLIEDAVNNEEEYKKMIRKLTKPKPTSSTKEKTQTAPNTSKKKKR